jgi:hypothetical protein
MKLDVQRKLGIENLTRCMNCSYGFSAFTTCNEPYKERVVECDHFLEVPVVEQIVVVRLDQWYERNERK